MTNTTPTPFQQGMAAFAAKASRFTNPCRPQVEGDTSHVEWERGYDHAAFLSIEQPQGNDYPTEVYQLLLAMAGTFRDYQYFSIADELEALATRGPEPYKGLDHLPDSIILEAASKRMAKLAVDAQRREHGG